MIAVTESFDPFDSTIYLQHCPMADNENGADWLSLDKEIKNPYFGASMLKCGEVKQEIKWLIKADTKAIHIAKSHQPKRKPKLGKEYSFPNADWQTGR